MATGAHTCLVTVLPVRRPEDVLKPTRTYLPATGLRAMGTLERIPAAPGAGQVVGSRRMVATAITTCHPYKEDGYRNTYVPRVGCAG